jgi:hypothetical protein
MWVELFTRDVTKSWVSWKGRVVAGKVRILDVVEAKRVQESAAKDVVRENAIGGFVVYERVFQQTEQEKREKQVRDRVRERRVYLKRA